MTTREGLGRAAKRATGRAVRFLEDVPIVETFRGETVWEGMVSVYESDAGKVYAWAVEGETEPQYVTVAHQPPVSSPISAVRAWIASTQRK